MASRRRRAIEGNAPGRLGGDSAGTSTDQPAVLDEIVGHAVQPSDERNLKTDAASGDLVQSGAAGFLVGRAGLEPATLGLRVPCTASCANGPERCYQRHSNKYVGEV